MDPVLDKDLIFFCRKLRSLENNAESILNEKFDPFIYLMTSDNDDLDNKRMSLWSEVKNNLNRMFYDIISEYGDELERLSIYSKMTKQQYYDMKDRQERAKDAAEENSWNDFSNQGLNDFYEGFDETELGID